MKLKSRISALLFTMTFLFPLFRFDGYSVYAQDIADGTTAHWSTIPGQPVYLNFDGDFTLSGYQTCLLTSINNKSVAGKTKREMETMLNQPGADGKVKMSFIDMHGFQRTASMQTPFLKTFYPQQLDLAGLQNEFKKIDQVPLSLNSPVIIDAADLLGNQHDLFIQACVKAQLSETKTIPVNLKSLQNQAAVYAASSCLRCGDFDDADKYMQLVMSTLGYDRETAFFTYSDNKLISLLIATNRLEIASKLCQHLLGDCLEPEMLARLKIAQAPGASKISKSTSYFSSLKRSRYKLLENYTQILEMQKSPLLPVAAECLYKAGQSYSFPDREDRTLLADLFLRTGKPSNALEIYTQDMESNRDSGSSTLYMTEALYYSHNALRVANVYNKLAKQKEAIKTLTDAIAFRKKVFSPQVEAEIARNSTYFPNLTDLQQALATVKQNNKQPGTILVDGPEQKFSFGYKDKLAINLGQALARAHQAVQNKDALKIQKSIMDLKALLANYEQESIDYLFIDLPSGMLGLARKLTDAGYTSESNALLTYLLGNPSKISKTAPYLINAELSFNQSRDSKSVNGKVNYDKTKTIFQTPYQVNRYFGALYLNSGHNKRAAAALKNARLVLDDINWKNFTAQASIKNTELAEACEARIAVLLDLARLEIKEWYQDKKDAHLVNASKLSDEVVGFIKMLRAEMVPVPPSAYQKTAICKTYCLCSELITAGKNDLAVKILNKMQPLNTPVSRSDPADRLTNNPLYLWHKLRCILDLAKHSVKEAASEGRELAQLRGTCFDISAPMIEAICASHGDDAAKTYELWRGQSGNLHEIQIETTEFKEYCLRQALAAALKTNTIPGNYLRSTLLDLGRTVADLKPKEALYFFDRALVGADDNYKATLKSEIQNLKERLRRDAADENKSGAAQQ